MKNATKQRNQERRNHVTVESVRQDGLEVNGERYDILNSPTYEHIWSYL